MMGPEAREWLDRKISRLEQRGLKFSISSRHRLTEAETAELTAWAAELDASLAPGDAREEIGRLVAALMLGFNRTGGEDEAKKTVALYVSQLSRFPVWAIRKACEAAFSDTKGGGRRFAPTVPEMVAYCNAAVTPARADRLRIGRLLAAEVYDELTDEARGRNLARLQNVMRREAQP